MDVCRNCLELSAAVDASGLCPTCLDALLNPLSPKLQALELETEVGQVMRDLTRRHAPHMLGQTAKLRRLNALDEVDILQEQKDPLRLVLTESRMQALVADIWTEGQPVPCPPEES